ncbi:MAG: protease complex subunit PrcB family protein [Verrucomicrobiaceae bacterium]
MRSIHLLHSLACLALPFVVTTSRLQAELPPAVYDELKHNSPESLTIEALSVKVSDSAVSVSAKVSAVERSRSGLKPGATIQIEYHSEKQTKPGPSEAPVLEKGKSYQAYLSQSDTPGIYQLAARGHSFETARAAIPQWRGQYEGSPNLSTQLIKTKDQWAASWGSVGRAMPQGLDETKEMAVYIAVGERRTGGFKPQVISASESDGKFVIVYTDGAPSPDSFVTQVITHPWVIAIVPKSSLPVEMKAKP